MPKIGELVRSGRAFVREKWGVIIAVLFVTIIINFLLGAVAEVFSENGGVSFFFEILSFVVTSLLTLGSTKIYLDIIDGKEERFADIFSQGKLLLRYLGMSILFSIGIFVGLLLLIVPGIYFALRYGLYSYVIVDRPELGWKAAFEESARMTDGIKWSLLVFNLAMVGINVLGLLALGIGLLYTIPVTIMAYVSLYRSLTRLVRTEETPEVSVAESVSPLASEPGTSAAPSV